MKRHLFITALMMLSAIAMAQNAKKVAILDIVDRENKVEYGVEFMLRSYLTDAINRTPGYEGYDRVDMASIIGEHNFQRTGLVSDAQIKKLGEMTGASYIILAEAAMLGADNIIINAKIIDVETARIVNTARPKMSSTRDTNSMTKACAELAIELLGMTSDTRNGNGDSSRTGGNTYSRGQNFTETVFGMNMKMIYVEGGTFTMGCTGEQGGDCDDDEKPIHNVKLSGYYIGKYEVTVAQFRIFINETGYRTDAEKEGWVWRWMKVDGEWKWNKVNGLNWRYNNNGYMRNSSEDNHPVLYVSWNDAKAFCEWLSRKTDKSYRLPTEAEWEYAARGGTKSYGYKYSGSNSISEVAWYGNLGSNATANGQTHSVGTKSPNELGIYDMSGNVWEWCLDWYGNYSSASQTDPVGPGSGSYRVLRGGGWNGSARSCRVANRDGDTPDGRNSNNGFRVVLH